jgi:hypothetical protein
MFGKILLRITFCLILIASLTSCSTIYRWTGAPAPNDRVAYPQPYPPMQPDNPYPNISGPSPYPASGDRQPSPWQPQPGDVALTRGEAFVNNHQILVLESFPPQFMLNLEGALPTPCHQLRVDVQPPDAQNRIQVSVYSLVDPTAVCIQVLSSFQANVRLDHLPAGKYTVLVNNVDVGQIEVP